MGPTESMLISTSVIWFFWRRQKPCCCALHFINHGFMWTRSGHLTAPTWALQWLGGLRHVYSLAQISEEQSSTLLITFDYFHLLGSGWLCWCCWRVGSPHPGQWRDMGELCRPRHPFSGAPQARRVVPGGSGDSPQQWGPLLGVPSAGQRGAGWIWGVCMEQPPP